MNSFLSDRFTVLHDVRLSSLPKDFVYQTGLLDSDNYNKSILSIFDHLEYLYEKTRLIQDAVEYLEAYISKSIETYTADCNYLLNEIEKQRDSIKQYNSYSSINVPLTISLASKKDRSGVVLPNTSMLNQCIVPKYTETEIYDFTNCQKIAGFTAYNSNITDNLKQNYRAFYSLDAPVQDGLIEEIQLNFNSEKDVNIINAITANCTIDQIKYIYNNTIEPEDYVVALIKRTKTMNGFNLVLKCPNYVEKVYYVDESRVQSDCWSKIIKNEYDYYLGKATIYTQSELNNLLGITSYQEAYDKYIKEIEAWKARRQAIVDVNTSNGYTDSVETFDVLKSPDTQGLNQVNVSTGRLENIILLKDDRYFFTASESNNVKIDNETLKAQINNLENVYPNIERYRYQTISSDRVSFNQIYKKIR